MDIFSRYQDAKISSDIEITLMDILSRLSGVGVTFYVLYPLSMDCGFDGSSNQYRQHLYSWSKKHDIYLDTYGLETLSTHVSEQFKFALTYIESSPSTWLKQRVSWVKANCHEEEYLRQLMNYQM